MSCGREKVGGRTGVGKGCPKRSGGAALGSAGVPAGGGEHAEE